MARNLTKMASLPRKEEQLMWAFDVAAFFCCATPMTGRQSGQEFVYKENVSNIRRLTCGATRLTFATTSDDQLCKFRLVPNIIWSQSGGAVEDLPCNHFESMGEIGDQESPRKYWCPIAAEIRIGGRGFIA